MRRIVDRDRATRTPFPWWERVLGVRAGDARLYRRKRRKTGRSHLVQQRQLVGEGIAREPRGVDPETGEHPRMQAAPFVGGDTGVAAVSLEREHLDRRRFKAGIDEPVFAHAGRLVLAELLVAIPRDALVRKKLDHQIGGTRPASAG